MKKSVLSGVVVCSLLVVSSSLAMAGGSRGGMVSATGRNRGPQGISQVAGLAAESDAQQLAPGGRVGKRGSKGTLPGGGGETLPPPPTGSDADFSGFSQGQEVGNAYASAGLIFTGATALQRYNGSGNPNAGIVYSPQGRMVIGFETLTARAVRFHYVSSVALTLTAHASANGTGAALSTRTLAATVGGSPFSSWAQIEEQLPAGVKSVVLTGTGDRWGLDAFGVATGCPAPASASDDCNGNGQSDACEIARGLVQDCNGNGKPDACDLSGIPPVPGAVQWRVEDGGNGHWYAGIRFNSATGWQVAKTDAEQRGGHLATAIDDAEAHFLFDVAGDSRLWVGRFGPWLGGYQDPSSAGTVEPAGGWRWVTGEPWFAWWDLNPNEPNNCCGGEDYLHFISLNVSDPLPGRHWNDLSDVVFPEVWSSIVEWDTGGSSDCNANGIPDSCDLASGTSADRNGNGIPDECDPNPVLALTSNASACNTVNSTVTVEARLSGASQPVVAGQMLVQWDASKLSLSSVNPGDAPFNVVYSLNPSAGQATVLVSVEPGSSGEVVGNKAMARLNFTVVGGSCDGSQTGVNFFSAGPLQTEFADGLGNAFAPTLVGSAGFVVDDGNPVLSNVPADRTVRPEAGDGAFATVSLGAPVATDSCSPLTETATRSDGQPLSAAYPVGVTTVTWRAVDPCGNSAEATTQVTVEPYNMMSVTVSLPGMGYPASLTRSLVVETVGVTTAAWSVLQENRTFVSGSASFDWGLPIDTYACLSVEDPARSLRRRVDVTDGGANWTATATLVLGDLIDDEVIDVLDWGAYVVRNPNTAHDLNGDGVTNAADGQFILDNFGVQGQGACRTAFSGPATAIESISVAELVQRGLPELAGADLNGDGWLDLADMGMAD